MTARKTARSGAVRRARPTDLRRWLRRKTRRAKKRVAKKLHLTTTTKKMRPTPPPKQTATAATGPQLRTLGGKPIPPPKRAAAPAQAGGKAAPMSQRVKRKGGKFNGSTAAKKTAAGKRTVAPNPEQRRLLAANKKAEQIDARLARTEKRIERMFPDQKGQ